VERTLCHGCRVTLPAVVVQRVRTSPNLVQCPSCGRILYAD
jgi:predicted  nucleic acid-binding Zn-ribbon protein